MSNPDPSSKDKFETHLEMAEASLRIEQALLKKSIALDLSGLGLKIVPHSLKSLINLQKLSLDGNFITSLPDWLATFTELQMLSLANNNLTTIPEALGSLIALQGLNLSNNHLSIVPNSLGNLAAMTWLALTNNELTAVPESFGNLTSLIHLHLDRNKLTNVPDSLANLTRLQQLFLHRNGIGGISESLGKLTSLQGLNLSSNKLTTVPDSLGDLTALTWLDISENKLTSIPDSFGNLSGLQGLNLSGNQLTMLPEVLCNLKSLTWIAINRSRLITVPESLGKLAALKSLSLSNNKIESVPVFVGNLINLETIYLHGNLLSALPESLGNLHSLAELHLDSNRLTSIPESLCNLSALKEINISINQLTQLPDNLGNLTSLRSLILRYNRLSAVPESIGNLSALQKLDLRNNALTTLPESLANLTKLQEFNLESNKINSEQMSAYDRGGWHELRRFLVKLQDKGEDAWVGKLVFVGNGNVGKSSLLDALRGKKPDPKRETTHGMVREQLHLKGDGKLIEDSELPRVNDLEIQIDFHCWDMGGQDAYRPIHQIFFTPDALYLLVYHGREDIGRGEVKKWLTLIRNRATSRAQVVLVASHCGKETSVTQPVMDGMDADLRGMIVDFVAVDSFEPFHIEDLRELLAKRSLENNYFKRRLLGGWHRFQKVLKEINRPYVEMEILVKNSEAAAHLNRQDTKALVQLAHDCGLLLWHHQNALIESFVVLHPDWLSQAIAYVIKDPQTRKNRGVMSHADLSVLWTNPGLKDSVGYPHEVHPMLVALMEENEISYRLSKHNGELAGERSLIAQLVDSVPPPEWRASWEAKAGEKYSEMVRHFSFVPPRDRKPQRLTGLMYRLIVSLHDYSLGKEDYHKAVHWQNGLIVQNEYGDLARIEFQDDDELEIRVRGLIPLGFMERLREILRQVAGEFWKGVELREAALCGEYCPSGFKTGTFDVDECLIELKEDSTHIRCIVQDCRKKVPLQLLLNPPVEPKHVVELRRLLNERFDSIDMQLQKAQKTLAGLGAQISTFQRLLREDIQMLMANMMDDGHDGPRLFCIRFMDPGFFDKPAWVATKIQVTLCCEHSQWPLPCLDKLIGSGVYEFEITKEIFIKPKRWLLLSARLALFVKTLGAAGALASLAPELQKMVSEGMESYERLIDKMVPDGTSTKLPGAGPQAETEGKSGPTYLENVGLSLEKDSAFAHWLRDKIRLQDKEYGGLKKVRDLTGKVLWVHHSFRMVYDKTMPSMK